MILMLNEQVKYPNLTPILTHYLETVVMSGCEVWDV